MNTFFVEVLASDKKFYEGRIVSLIVPCPDGQKEVLAHHEDMLIAVDNGELKFKTVEGEWKKAICGTGFAQVANNRVVVLVETAETPEEIDVKRAQRAKEKAEEELRQKRSLQEYHSSQAALARALSRLRYVDKQ